MSRFPGNRRFAFTIFDDTDGSSVENTSPVYKLLTEIGLRVTKSVWPLANLSSGRLSGGTLQDAEYLGFVRALRDEGHEIALHCVRNSDSVREVVKRGLQEFQDRLGLMPRAHANHSRNRENLYWGESRITTPMIRALYETATGFRNRGTFEGHIEHSPYFWGDMCLEHVDYVRNFVLGEINLDRVNPTMPYHNPKTPFVKAWFTSTDGCVVNRFCETCGEAQQDRLEEEGGVCIMYTHFSCGFFEKGLHPRFETLMRRLASKNGWFVPVSTLLDHLLKQNPLKDIPAQELTKLERHWLAYKLRHGPS